MTTRSRPLQGHLLGIPYDLRRPTWARFVRRAWCPGGRLWQPHAFGWGYTLNLAHPAARWVLLGLGAVLGLAIALDG